MRTRKNSRYNELLLHRCHHFRGLVYHMSVAACARLRSSCPSACEPTPKRWNTPMRFPSTNSDAPAGRYGLDRGRPDLSQPIGFNSTFGALRRFMFIRRSLGEGGGRIKKQKARCFYSRGLTRSGCRYNGRPASKEAIESPLDLTGKKSGRQRRFLRLCIIIPWTRWCFPSLNL